MKPGNPLPCTRKAKARGTEEIVIIYHSELSRLALLQALARNTPFSEFTSDIVTVKWGIAPPGADALYDVLTAEYSNYNDKVAAVICKDLHDKLGGTR